MVTSASSHRSVTTPQCMPGRRRAAAARRTAPLRAAGTAVRGIGPSRGDVSARGPGRATVRRRPASPVLVRRRTASAVPGVMFRVGRALCDVVPGSRPTSRRQSSGGPPAPQATRPGSCSVPPLTPPEGGTGWDGAAGTPSTARGSGRPLHVATSVDTGRDVGGDRGIDVRRGSRSSSGPPVLGFG
jgi:hypothetical protein